MDEVTTRDPDDSEGRECGNSKRNSSERQRWQVAVDVYLLSVDPLEFHVESPLQSAPDHDIVFRNNGHPGFEVIFTLYDETDDPNGYTFVKHKEDAIWSRLGPDKTYCPTAGVWDIFEPLRLSDNRMVLVAYNPNADGAVGPFQYALNVTNGERTVSLDPGGNNMNGPGFSNY